jgi:hypothetical protein
MRLRLRDQFEYYAPRCLNIRTKSGAIEPLRRAGDQLNRRAGEADVGRNAL